MFEESIARNVFTLAADPLTILSVFSLVLTLVSNPVTLFAGTVPVTICPPFATTTLPDILSSKRISTVLISVVVISRGTIC